MNFVRRLYDWVLGWSESRWGEVALFAVAFVESSFFPIPPDVLLIALCLGRPARAFRYALICTAGSVLGALGGYAIGYYLWQTAGGELTGLAQWVFNRGIFSPEDFEKVRVMFEQWDFWIIFTAGFTPIPYKLFTIAAGLFDIGLGGFVAGAGVAREVRVKEAVKAAAVGEVKGRAEETAAGKVVEVAVVKIKDKAAGKAQEIRAAIHGREAIREIREEMGKDKLRKFAENLTFENLVQPEFDEIFGRDHKLKGHWAADFFGNDKPIVLELGCGKGEYTVGMGAANPEKNFMGIDIKGARMWRGAKTATEMGLGNVGFLRTRIEFIGSFFAPGEIAEIWITFPDPQLKKGREKKRLTAPGFLDRYRAFLVPGGMVHLKTDSRELHDYTLEVVAEQGLELHCASADIYGEGLAEVYSTLQIKTAYERRFLTEGKPITYLSISLK